jgi:diaminopimelate decarboxylase
MKKIPFVTKEQLENICRQYPTPFHLYDETGIRATARSVNTAFSWNGGYKEYFAVKATPTPQILDILHQEGCGVDCSSLTELMMARRCGFSGEEIMFSANETPAEEYVLAAELGAIINLDDITHVDFLKDTIGYIPETISCRYNPGGVFQLGKSKEGFQVMDNPGDAKYGMTKPQLFEAFRRLKELGAKRFGIHSFLASNTISNDYYPELAGQLFQLAVELERETGADVCFINLSGGVGVDYRPDQSANNISAIGGGVRRKFEEILVPAGMGDVKVTVRVAWFNKSPRPSMGTVAQTTRSASSVMEAEKLCMAKLKSKSGLFSQ